MLMRLAVQLRVRGRMLRRSRGLYLQTTCWEELADRRNLQRGILVQDNERFTLLQDNFKLDRVFYTNHNNFIGCTVRDNHVV